MGMGSYTGINLKFRENKEKIYTKRLETKLKKGGKGENENET